MKKFTTLITLLTITLAACTVPPASEENSIETQGTIVGISEGGTLDVVLTLEGDQNTYYINRGLENGLTLEGLKEKILHKEVTLKYADMLIDMKSYHIYEVSLDDELVYSEMPEKS